jgi:enediyne biosynthesis protein E3
MNKQVIESLNILWKSLLKIPVKETTFAVRGFQGKKGNKQQRLEQIGQVFLEGYHTALDNENPDELGILLNAIDPEFQGFAFEGAAMALGLLDFLTPWRRNRLQKFLESSGATHCYMAHVGAGWVLARLHRKVEPSLARLDPLLGWLVVDGYGFHEGYFHWQQSVKEQKLPKRLTGYALRVFDQGLGRSLWFLDGADVERIPATIAAFPQQRWADLWSGVGLACAYAGGVDRLEIEHLWKAADSYRPCLSQGAAFAAKTRQRAGNPANHTELACQVLCGLGAERAAEITDLALENLPQDGMFPAYEIWRQRIQAKFSLREVAV